MQTLARGALLFPRNKRVQVRAERDRHQAVPFVIEDFFPWSLPKEYLH